MGNKYGGKVRRRFKFVPGVLSAVEAACRMPLPHILLHLHSLFISLMFNLQTEVQRTFDDVYMKNLLFLKYDILS